MIETLRLWEEPLYRLIIQILILQAGILLSVVLGIVAVRMLRLLLHKRAAHYEAELYTPLMSYLAEDMPIESIFETTKRYPKKTICLELERYAIMLGGEALTLIRALYERLNLRNHGIKLSHSWLWWRRLEGIRILGLAGGHDIVDVLLDALNDRHPAVRLGAARSLGRTKNPKAIEPILEAMSGKKQLAQRQLAQTLVEFGPAAYPALRRIVQRNKDGRTTAMAMEMLAITGDLGSIPSIKTGLLSEEFEVRIAAYKAAILLHAPLSKGDLEEGLNDDEWPVRAQAALAAGRIGNGEIVSKLGECLSDRFWWVRNNAGAALSNLGRDGKKELERIRNESDDPFARDMANRTLTSDPAYLSNPALPTNLATSFSPTKDSD